MSSKRFLEIFESNIKREGSKQLLEWLKSTDFFEAPASSRFHGNHRGGLVEHSVNVYENLVKIYRDGETAAIVSLLHDVCKANLYTLDTRNEKKNGTWVSVPFYKSKDSLGYGHGEASVYLISKHMQLTEQEALAIRWHMGGFDSAFKGGDNSISTAWGKYPLGALLHCADLMATYVDEG